MLNINNIKNKLLSNLNPVDYITIIYLLLTFLYTIFNINKLASPFINILFKIIIVLFVFIIIWLSNSYNNKITRFIRAFYPLVLLGYLYGETDYLNNLIFNNLDRIIIEFENKIFGCEPGLFFYELFPQKWFNEIMNFGYFSYYFLNFIVCLSLFIYRKKEYYKNLFIIIFSFYLFYLFYIIFPVVGPQFYYQPPKSSIGEAFFFRDAVKFVQFIGEKPTAAFPSSHVGIALILLIISYKNLRKLFFIILPPCCILLFATIYIKAHYITDVVAGLISGLLLYKLSLRSYIFFQKKLCILKITDRQ